MGVKIYIKLKGFNGLVLGNKHSRKDVVCKLHSTSFRCNLVILKPEKYVFYVAQVTNYGMKKIENHDLAFLQTH